MSSASDPPTVSTPLQAVPYAPDVPGYRMIKQLGQGGQGSVWQAIDEKNARKVAVKFIRRDILQHPSAVARFDQECRVLELVEHPNLVHVHDAGQLAGGERWLAMEYVGNRNLKQYVDELDDQTEGRFPVREVLEVFVQLCNALHTAHELGVIHRDIKPGNIVVDEDDRAVLVDFGLAKAADVQSPDAITMTGQFMGSPAYASPEQLAGKVAKIKRQTDVYSLGITLYEALTGALPYRVREEVNLQGVLRVIEESDPVPPQQQATSIDRELALVILKAIAKEPERRYQTTRAFADDLQAFLDGKPVSAAGDSIGYRARKFAQRNKALVSSLAVAFLLSIGFGVVVFNLYLQQVGLTQEKNEALQAKTVALDEKNDALAAEKEAKQIAESARLASIADQAKLAAEQGKWQDVLDNIDEALAGGHPDSVSIQLMRCEAMYSLQRDNEALALIESLAGKQELGDQVGRVKLWEGFLTLSQVEDGREDGVELVQEALASGTLVGTDKAFAQGLVADTLPEAAMHFREALRSNPFNRTATVMLAITDVVLGDLNEATTFVDQALALRPDDPALHSLNAILAGLAEDPARAEDSIARAAEYIGDDEAALLEDAVNILLRIRGMVQKAIDDGPQAGKSQVVAIVPEVMAAFQRMQTSRDLSNSPLFELGKMMPPAFAPLFESAQHIVGATLHMNIERALTDIEEVARVAPSGHIMLLSAVVNANAGRNAKALELYERARTLPTLFEIDCFCSSGIVTAKIELALPLIIERKWLDARARLDEVGIVQATKDFANDCAGSWVAQPFIVGQLTQILAPMGYPDLTRELVFAMGGPEPTDPHHLYARGLANYYLGAYGPASQDVAALLAVQPNHDWGKKLQTDIQARMGTVGRPPFRGETELNDN